MMSRQGGVPDRNFGPRREVAAGVPKNEVTAGAYGPDTDPEYGGVMPVDSTPREYIDGVASQYPSVRLDYGEGVVHIEGSREEVHDFVEEVTGESKWDIVADGGSEFSPKMAGPMGPGTKGPDPDYMADGGERTSEEAEMLSDITHVREDIGYEDGAPM